MKGTQYTQLMDPYATENAGLSPISTSNYNIGAQVNSCIPAGWWDFLFNNLVTRARQSYNDINVLYTEILNVLSAAGVTPSEADSTQLVQSLGTLFNAVPIATHNAVGKVKSSSGKGNVSVDSQTGIMTANGVGAMGDSTSGINSNPSVTNIISALSYLSRSMGGHQIAIPAKPENWQINDTEYGYFPSSNESTPSSNIALYRFEDDPDGTYPILWNAVYGVSVTGGNVLLAVRGGVRMFCTVLNPGWYRICIWGGSGGKGGNSGGQPKGSYSGSSIGGSISGYITVSGYSANAGEDGYAGAAGYIDLYFPKATKITGILGYGGNAGQNGGTPSTGGYGSPYVASGGSVGSLSVKAAYYAPAVQGFNVNWITKDAWHNMATRDPSFIKGTAGTSGSASGSIPVSETGSSYNYSGNCYYNGGGGGGANGGGTFIRVGDIPLFCHGGVGGDGAGHASKSFTLSVGGGTSRTYTIPATTGGDAAVNYEGSIRAPLAMSSGFNSLVTDHPGLMDGTEEWRNYVIRSAPRYYMSPCLKEALISISSGTATIAAGGATTTISAPSGTSKTNGFPGGIAIFRGANV